MKSKGDKPRILPKAFLLSLSLLLHAALLLLPLPGPRPSQPPPEPDSIVVELVQRSVAPEASELPTEPVPEQRREDSVDPDGQPAELAAAEQSPAGSLSTPVFDTPAPDETAPAADRIRTQLLVAARRIGRESEQTQDGARLDYGQTPSLPSPPGWLHQFTGRVDASIDRWRGNDGGRNARIVTSSGRVFCVRTRAPTNDEIFNPWMSTAVPMVSDCGRERPQPINIENPWARLPED